MAASRVFDMPRMIDGRRVYSYMKLNYKSEVHERCRGHKTIYPFEYENKETNRIDQIGCFDCMTIFDGAQDKHCCCGAGWEELGGYTLNSTS